MNDKGVVEHAFRHDYGQLVAVLVRRVGARHWQAAEDAVQAALEKALVTWTAGAIPDNPTAWLHRVAHRELMSALRQTHRREQILATHSGELRTSLIDIDDVEPPLPGEIRDDFLRLMFVCCDTAIPARSQLVLALKTLCGFSVREIAERLFISEANVYKRFSRGRDRLAVNGDDLLALDVDELQPRRAGVLKVLYLLFTEGHLSVQGDAALRGELCDEAIRLTTLLAEHPVGNDPATAALLALMYLHRARSSSRSDGAGGLLLLEEQDRSRWDQRDIQTGLYWLAQSAQGQNFSRYHAEAGVAAEHCLAPSFADTRWDRVAECYEILEAVAPSPLHRLNRAMAIAEWRGADAGLRVLADYEPPPWLADSYQWAAVHADLLTRAARLAESRKYQTRALGSAPNQAIRALLGRRWAMATPSEPAAARAAEAEHDQR